MNLFLTPSQNVILNFKLNYSQIPDFDTRISVDLDPIFNIDLEEKKLLPGFRFSALSKKAIFKFSVPENILKGRKKKIIHCLGTFKILQNSRQIYCDDMRSAIIIDNNTFFEQKVVPKILMEMGYIVDMIGGKKEPDIVTFHKIINSSEKINVETTITSNYNTARWDHDIAKFNRYKKERKLRRLLIVTQSNTISSDVIGYLNETRDPIGLVEFKDLKSIYNLFKASRDYSIVVTKLSQAGKIVCPSILKENKLFIAQQINITRNI